jgi:hypothetical protein
VAFYGQLLVTFDEPLPVIGGKGTGVTPSLTGRKEGCVGLVVEFQFEATCGSSR